MVSGAPDLTEVEPVGIDAATVVSALLIFVLAYALARVVTYALTRLSERSVERRITVKMFVPLIKFVVYAGAVVYVLGSILNLSSAQILAFSGLLGAVLALGIQDLFANIVGGIVITFERPYRIGDKVEFDGHYGEITDIGIRSTKLTTPDDTLVTIPNYLFFTNAVSNANDGAAEMMAVVELHVAPGADVDRASDVLRDALRTSRYVYLSDDHGVVVRVGDSGGYTTLRGKAYVNDVRNENAFRSDVTERTLRKFDEEGIERADPVAGVRRDAQE